MKYLVLIIFVLSFLGCQESSVESFPDESLNNVWIEINYSEIDPEQLNRLIIDYTDHVNTQQQVIISDQEWNNLQHYIDQFSTPYQAVIGWHVWFNAELLIDQENYNGIESKIIFNLHVDSEIVDRDTITLPLNRRAKLQTVIGQ